MKINFSVLLIIFLCSVGFVKAQDGKSILDKASQAYINAKGISASFTINTEEVGRKITYSQDGKILLRGNKFKIDVVDGITWFDGTTQWVYSKGSDEVNVSNPTNEELATVSPVVLLNLYKSGFNIKNKGEQNENGKSVYSIELIPQNKKSDFKKMIICVKKDDYILTSIKMFGKNGVNSHLIINQIKLKEPLSDTIFVFNKNEYPQAEIIDLR